MTFGPDRVKEFCAKNNLQKIVRAHECVMDGFERFAQGHLITCVQRRASLRSSPTHT